MNVPIIHFVCVHVFNSGLLPNASFDRIHRVSRDLNDITQAAQFAAMRLPPQSHNGGDLVINRSLRNDSGILISNQGASATFRWQWTGIRHAGCLAENADERSVLDRLAASKVVWVRRGVVLATFALIRKKEFQEIFRLAEICLKDEHDLLHKAIRWMLREMRKRDQSRLEEFLTKHASVMPRTMLRYSIENLSSEKRTK